MDKRYREGRKGGMQPLGRDSHFTDSLNLSKKEKVVGQGKTYSDGQPIMAVDPAKVTRGATRGYAQGEKYRADLREDKYPGK